MDNGGERTASRGRDIGGGRREIDIVAMKILSGSLGLTEFQGREPRTSIQVRGPGLELEGSG